MSGSQIKQLREERGWTQDDLASHFACSVRKIKGWESGEYEPSASEIRDLRNLSAGAPLEPVAAGGAT